MSTFPKIEAMLLEIRQALGLKGYQTKKKDKFASARYSLTTHQQMLDEVMLGIFTQLELDEDAVGDLRGNMQGFADAYKEVELNTWTFAATKRQIVWMLLGYFYVPGTARHVSFWNIHSVLDKGMPGGRFWYLPETCKIDGSPKLILPIAQVVDWLLDMLGMPLEEFADQQSEHINGGHESLRRSLYNWRNKTTIQLGTIGKYFSDDAKLNFKGAFSHDECATPAEKFSAAIEFVKYKGLTADKLRTEIPMTAPGRLERILTLQADEDEQGVFVECLVDRYSPPSPRVIRRRLLIARAMQSGYIRLLNYFCPNVEPTCANSEQNKLVQLIAIYKYIYNLAIDANRCCGHQGEYAENEWFEANLSNLGKAGLFLLILPSCRATANLELAMLLTRCFEDVQPGEELEDHVLFDAETMQFCSPQSLGRIVASVDEEKSAEDLIEQMRRSSPWRALQKENRFTVVRQVVQSEKLPTHLKEVSIKRLRELARTPSEAVQPILYELSGHLNNERKSWTQKSYGKVSELLKEAEASEGYELWRAAILQYKGKHLLACNDFVAASELFIEALDVSYKQNCGTLHGEIARECFATLLASGKLCNNNQEKYYREMLWSGMFESFKIPTIEEVTVWAEKYFWKTLYKPYYGFKKIEPKVA
ncbi:hypothetical protein [Halodesulfovibrio aestuarii]|uniref:Uncharacterized protein n=1 Tax=Halodesulfovibrio aestuarii TaxID=126333 RepID=A0ABV4JWG3_9BACT